MLQNLLNNQHRLLQVVNNLLLLFPQLIVMAFLHSPWQLQTALGLGGAGFIAYALAQVKRIEDRKAEEDRYNQIMEKMEQILQEIQKEAKPERSGTAIADIITSSLKYYADQVIKPKEEEE